LSRLNERYEAWIQSYDKSNLLIIEVDNIDFVENKNDFKSIIKSIDSKLK
jgi:deoxyadenosine/deoxycytidine kinase